MNEELCYVFISWGIDDIFRIHGIFTHEQMQNMDRSTKIKIMKEKLRHDNYQTFIIPINHFVEKGMII